MNPLRDFPLWLLNDVPERQPKYAHRSLLVLIPIAGISIGFFVWSLVVLPLWIALTAGIAAIVLGFVAVQALVNRIVPKRLPPDEDS